MLRFGVAVICVAFVPVLAAGCDGRGPASRPAAVTWDLSADQDESRVGWPADVAGDEWVIEGPVTVDLALNGTDRGRVTFQQGRVWRNGDKVARARLLLAPASIDDAYAQAKALAETWRVTDVEELEKWHTLRGKSVEHPKSGWVDTGRLDLPEPRSVQIRPSFAGEEVPWYVIFGFGFP